MADSPVRQAGSVVLVATVFFGPLLLFYSVMDFFASRSSRFLVTPAAAHWRDGCALAFAVFLFAAFLTKIARWHRRNGKAPKQVFAQCFWISLPIAALAFLLGVLLQDAIGTAFFVTARRPSVLQASVVDSGVISAYRSGIRRVARFRLADGTVQRMSVEDSIWNSHGNSLRVNGACKLSSLPTGLPVDLHVRQSSLGIAVDAITSSKDCAAAG